MVFRSSKLIEDEISVMVYQYLWSQMLQQRVSVVAVLDEEIPKPQIVGLQILSVTSKNDPPLPEVRIISSKYRFSCPYTKARAFQLHVAVPNIVTLTET